MAKRISQTAINWAAIAERVPPGQKAQFTAFKTKSDRYLRRVLANPEVPPKIDWNAYKSKVPIPGMVDTFMKGYEALKVPYPADTQTKQVEDQEKQVKAEIAEFKSESNKKISEYKANIAYINSLLPFDQMTMEDFRDSFPDMALDSINKPTFWPHDEEEQMERPAQEGHH